MPKDFAEAPFLVIWETTQACDLACKHCRAEAQPLRHPDELTTAEAKKLLEDKGIQLAGDPAASVLYRKVSGEDLCGPAMPPGSPLRSAEIDAVRRWIAAGAPF